MRNIHIFLLAIAVLLGPVSSQFSFGGQRTERQSDCIVQTHKKLKKRVYVDHDAHRIYFCCKMCRKKFIKNPKKFIRRAKKKGIRFEKLVIEDEEDEEDEKKVDGNDDKSSE